MAAASEETISDAAEPGVDPVETAREADEATATESESPTHFRIDRPFRPLLQVDHYKWPRVCRRLADSAADEIERLADAIVSAMAAGHKVQAIAGCRPGEGAPTLVMCAGRCIAQRRYKAILVDANAADPQLGKQLGLLPERGWEEVLAGRLPLEEVVIETPRYDLAVLPMCEPFVGTGSPEDETRAAESIETLAAHYDLVLIDLGPLGDPQTVGGPFARGIAQQLSTVALVHNTKITSSKQLIDVQQHLVTANISQTGLIENFV